MVSGAFLTCDPASYDKNHQTIGLLCHLEQENGEIITDLDLIESDFLITDENDNDALKSIEYNSDGTFTINIFVEYALKILLSINNIKDVDVNDVEGDLDLEFAVNDFFEKYIDELVEAQKSEDESQELESQPADTVESGAEPTDPGDKPSKEDATENSDSEESEEENSQSQEAAEPEPAPEDSGEQPSDSPEVSEELQFNVVLQSGDSVGVLEPICSPNEKYCFFVQRDRNLVVRDSLGKAVGASNTNIPRSRISYQLVMEPDNMLCMRALVSDLSEYDLCLTEGLLGNDPQLLILNDGSLEVRTDSDSRIIIPTSEN